MKRVLLLVLNLVLFIGCAKYENVDDTVVFYPAPPQQPKLQFLLTINGEDDIGEPLSALQDFLVGDDRLVKKLERPYDIHSSPGKIYVLDKKFNKLFMIDLAKRKLSYLEDQRLGKLTKPSGIWVTEDDIKYIADMKRKQIVVFDADNEYLRTYGKDDILGKPVDVAVYEDRVYICDIDKHQIFVLDKGSGRLLATIGTAGKRDEQLYKPSHINIDKVGNIYVTDAFNFKVKKFDQNFKFVKSYGFHGDSVGAFARPKGLAVDRDNHMYVVDSAFENVQIFDAETSRILLFFGGGGAGPGKMYLPAGIHIDYANADYFKNYVDKDFALEYVVYVGNMYGSNKLNVYGFGKWNGPSFSGGSNKAGDNSNGNNEAK